jgi:hypothetical protein
MFFFEKTKQGGKEKTEGKGQKLEANQNTHLFQRKPQIECDPTQINEPQSIPFFFGSNFCFVTESHR